MRKGFSLVELAIVLVILGLLVGGILAGQSLIRASELRSVSSDYAKYRTAVFAFRDKYMALPGDMPNATHFWGAAGGAAPPATGLDTTCRDVVIPAGTATCNGEGNRQITSASSSNYRYESVRAWQHLSNAGLVEGGYTGTTATANSYAVVLGTHVPKGKLNNGGFMFRAYLPASASDTSYFPSAYGNILYYAAQASSPALLTEPVMVPADAWNIDTKMDDGRPAYGALIVPEDTTNCHTNTDPALSQYDLDESGITCLFLYLYGI